MFKKLFLLLCLFFINTVNVSSEEISRKYLGQLCLESSDNLIINSEEEFKNQCSVNLPGKVDFSKDTVLCCPVSYTGIAFPDIVTSVIKNEEKKEYLYTVHISGGDGYYLDTSASYCVAVPKISEGYNVKFSFLVDKKQLELDDIKKEPFKKRREE